MLSMTTTKTRDLTKYFQPLLTQPQQGSRSILTQRALFMRQKQKKTVEVKEVTAEMIDEVIFDIKMDDSSAKAPPRPIHAERYRISVAKLESVGGLGLLLELQSGRKSSETLQQEWPETKHFDVVLHEDCHGWRTIQYVEPTMQAWNLNMSHPMIHSVWTLYRLVGIYVDMSTVQ